jgi:hypothetical protein
MVAPGVRSKWGPLHRGHSACGALSSSSFLWPLVTAHRYHPADHDPIPQKHDRQHYGDENEGLRECELVHHHDDQPKDVGAEIAKCAIQSVIPRHSRSDGASTSTNDLLAGEFCRSRGLPKAASRTREVSFAASAMSISGRLPFYHLRRRVSLLLQDALF